jgi:hypothetical protein
MTILVLRKTNKDIYDKLYQYGYIGSPLNEMDNRQCGIVCNGKVAVGIHEALNIDEYISKEDAYDCGVNEELFLALAAQNINIESNKYKWFVIDEEQQWVNLHSYIPKGTLYQMYENINDNLLSGWKSHRASNDEIIKHFTNNGKTN